jgi:hypothetical protein
MCLRKPRWEKCNMCSLDLPPICCSRAPYPCQHHPFAPLQISIKPIVDKLNENGFDCDKDSADAGTLFARVSESALFHIGLNLRQVTTVQAAQGALNTLHAHHHFALMQHIQPPDSRASHLTCVPRHPVKMHAQQPHPRRPVGRCQVCVGLNGEACVSC